MALTVKTIGIGAKLTIKENDWVGPKVVPYEPFSRDRVESPMRLNDDPAPERPTPTPRSTLGRHREKGERNICNSAARVCRARNRDISI